MGKNACMYWILMKFYIIIHAISNGVVFNIYYVWIQVKSIYFIAVITKYAFITGVNQNSDKRVSQIDLAFLANIAKCCE